MLDYHTHSRNSFDANFSVEEMARAALNAGVSELCITDHVDFDDMDAEPCSMLAQRREIDSVRMDGIVLRRGAEVGMKDDLAAKAAWRHIKDADLDFIIGSVQTVNGENVYYPEYHKTRSRETAYRAYLQTIAGCIRACRYFSVLGHYDFVCKYAPYEKRGMSYFDFADEFDDIFSFLIQNGKGIEINTASWHDDPAWGLDILTRYRVLGGEFVTLGSDAHKPENVGRRLAQAAKMAKEAGIKYVASYKKLKPNMLPIDKLV